MKKYMITAAAFLMIAGMANAQLAAKSVSTISKTSPAKPALTATTAAHKTATVTAASSTPSVTPKQSTAASTIKRKHHYKKGKALQKTVSK